MNEPRPVYVVDGRRTPILKARGRPGPFAASDLAVACARDLMLRYPSSRTAIDESVWGCVMPSADEANIARIISLRLELDPSVPAQTVQRNCASGLQALDTAAQQIRQGHAELVLAGGTEAMSRAPILMRPEYVAWLSDLSRVRWPWSWLNVARRLRPSMLRPVFGLKCGLRDPVVGLNMGETAEEVGHLFQISRHEMDLFALESHELATRAQESGIFEDELVPLYDHEGRTYERDDGVRPDTSMEQLSALKPVFDRGVGKVTAGNSAQISDGAAALLLASEDAVERYQLPTLGILHCVQWVGLEPQLMGLGPVHAMRALLDRIDMQVEDIDCFEINEAFAAQVLGCLKAWNSEWYQYEWMGRDSCPGPIDKDRLNPHGGSIAMGHPVGMSGARIVLHLLKQLRRMKGRFGIASLCIGGGQGGAALVEGT